MRSIIQGTGMYVPDRIIDNHALARIMDTNDEWIQVRTGIKERHMAGPDQATSDMAAPAAQQALDRAGLSAADIDYLILATMTPDMYFPGSAPFVQRKLGMPAIPCLDIRQQCAGFIYGLQLADALIRSGQQRHVLLVGAEVHAGFMPYKSWDVLYGESDHPVDAEEWEANTAARDRCILFGDGAGAVVISGVEDESRGIRDVLLYTDGNKAELLCTRAGGSNYRPYFNPSMTEDGSVIPMVEGREVYRMAVSYMPKVVLEILDRNNLQLDDLDMVIMHQANLRINEAVQKRLGLPNEKVFNNIQRYGNTTAATIPIAYHEALEQGRIKAGDLVCFVGLGSGLNWGAVLYQL